MSSRDVRSYRRLFTTTELDLNRAPSSDNREQQQEGPSTQQQVAMIDLDAIDDDDVVESSPTAVAQAKTKSRRNRGRTIVDVDLEDQTRVTNNNSNRCGRDPPNQTIVNGDLYINLEGGSSSMKEKAGKSPPKDPVFNCPICMGPLIEATSTRCGHIFCKNCIRAAITAQGKCPTCRKKVTVRELIRVFLPSTS